MPLNGLTVSTGLKLGPLLLETLVKHYFERLKAAHETSATTSSDGIVHDGKQGGSALSANLRQEELLYDQAFILAKVSITRVLVICIWLYFAITVADTHDLIFSSPRGGTQDFVLTASR